MPQFSFLFFPFSFLQKKRKRKRKKEKPHWGRQAQRPTYNPSEAAHLVAFPLPPYETEATREQVSSLGSHASTSPLSPSTQSPPQP